MRIETYDKIMSRIGLSILTFFIWLIGTAFFYGLFLVIILGVEHLFGISLSSQTLLILAAIIGGPFSIFATFYCRSATKYGSGNGIAFRDWWLIFGHEIDFGNDKAKNLDNEELNKWATENCSHFWRKCNKMYYTSWIFWDEAEAMAFKLRWS